MFYILDRMYLGDPNITKKGLLCLKDSKPVPITAHSGECIIPCIYTETVKKVLKAKGSELPLTPAKLAEARKLAKTIPGHYKHDPSEKAGGTSHAKGTTNVTVNIKNVIPHGRQGMRRKRGGRKGGSTKIITSRASGLIPTPPMINQPAYNLIRPFAANTPVGFEPRPMPTMEQARLEIAKENALEKRLLAYDKLNETVNRLEQQNRQIYSDYLVDEDSFVNRGRDEKVREKLAPKSEAVIEDVSEASAPYEPAAEPAVSVPSAETDPDKMNEHELTEFLRGLSKEGEAVFRRKLWFGEGGLTSVSVDRYLAMKPKIVVHGRKKDDKIKAIWQYLQSSR